MKFIDVICDYDKLKKKRDNLVKSICNSKNDEFKSKATLQLKEIQGYIERIENLDVEHKRIVG